MQLNHLQPVFDLSFVLNFSFSCSEPAADNRYSDFQFCVEIFSLFEELFISLAGIVFVCSKNKLSQVIVIAVVVSCLIAFSAEERSVRGDWNSSIVVGLWSLL
jgi:hypothetical protein